MAIGHIAVRAHSRSAGHSAAAAIAYRFGLALTCSRTGERHDFSRRSQRDDIGACGLTPGPFGSPGALADAIEGAERRKNSRLLRDVQIALPAELDDDARAALAEQFAGTLAERYGTVTAWAVHRPDKRSDARNHHAHIVLPTRSLDEHGKLGKKIRALDDRQRGPEEIEAIRALWETRANEALRAAGHDARVHTGRTTDPEPTLGPTHTAIERRAWSKRHRGQTPPAMSASRLVIDDGQCTTGRGRRLARHSARRAVLEKAVGRRHAPRSVPVPDVAPRAPVVALEPVPDAHPDLEPRPGPLSLPRAPVVALEPVPDAHPDLEPRPGPLSLPRAPVVALEPVPDAHPDPEAWPEPLSLPRAPVTALEPVPDVHPDPEPLPEPLPRLSTLARLSADITDLRTRLNRMVEDQRLEEQRFNEQWREDQRLEEQRLRVRLRAQFGAARTRAPTPPVSAAMTPPQVLPMTTQVDEVSRARRRRGPVIQAHADTHGQAPTQIEAETTRARLERDFGTLADTIAELRFFPRTEAPPIGRSTAERLRGKIERRGGRSVRTAGCQTEKGAAAAAKPLDQALDEIGRQNLNGALHPHEYRSGWFGRSLKDACKAARTAWTEVRENVIKKMVLAATEIEAIAERQRLQRLHREHNERARREAERAKREAEAEARRRKMAAVPTRPVQRDHGRGWWD